MGYARFGCAFLDYPYREKMRERDSIELAAFGELLKAFRKRKGLSQQLLAEKLAVHRNTIGTWERGDYLPDSRGIVMELAHQLDLSEDETRRLLEASLTALSPHWYVPYQRNPFFTGRDELLRHLHAALAPAQPKTSIQPCALSGLGGIGKTQAALEYAYRHYQDYSAVFWLSAETRSTLLSSLLAIADLLRLAEQPELDQVVEAVMHWLNAHSSWLLIVDNVEDIGLVKPFLPAARGGAVLLTTRLQALAGLAHIIEMPPMTREEGAHFLLQRAQQVDPSVSVDQVAPPDYSAAAALAALMDGLPLALDQAGAYIEETQSSLSDFLHLFESHPVALLHERDAFSDHPASVVKTFLLAFEKVQQASSAAADLLTACSFLAPDAIPEAILLQGAPYLGPTLQSVLPDPFLFNAALKTLLAYSLMRRNATTKTLITHRLVQTVLKAQLPEPPRRAWAARVLQMIDQSFPADFMLSDYWQRCEQLLPHALACLTPLEEEHAPALDSVALRAKIAFYHLSRGRYDEAEALWLDALQVYERILGPDHLDLAYSLNGLGMLYSVQGKYSRAEQHFQRAIRLCEQAGLCDHPQLASGWHGLAVLYREQGAYEQAERLFQRTLAMREREQGEDHPWVGMALNDLALLYFRQGNYAQAEQHFQRAARIWEQSGDPSHPYLIACLHRLGTLYSMQGRYTEASKIFQRIVPAWEQVRHFNRPYLTSF
jgi:tetratricopeptide (TPR) repeat protein/transcriptional regulator with XRE-family HTH domain